MLSRASVAVAAIIGAVVVIVSFVGALTLLALNDKTSEVLVALVVTPVVGLLIAVLRKMTRLDERTSQIQHQTNGTNTRLLDKVLNDDTTRS